MRSYRPPSSIVSCCSSRSAWLRSNSRRIRSTCRLLRAGDIPCTHDPFIALRCRCSAAFTFSKVLRPARIAIELRIRTVNSAIATLAALLTASSSTAFRRSADSRGIVLILLCPTTRVGTEAQISERRTTETKAHMMQFVNLKANGNDRLWSHNKIRCIHTQEHQVAINTLLLLSGEGAYTISILIGGGCTHVLTEASSCLGGE